MNPPETLNQTEAVAAINYFLLKRGWSYSRLAKKIDKDTSAVTTVLKTRKRALSPSLGLIISQALEFGSLPELVSQYLKEQDKPERNESNNKSDELRVKLNQITDELIVVKEMLRKLLESKQTIIKTA